MKFLLKLLMNLGLSGYLAQQLARPNGFFGSRFIGRMMNKGNAELEQLALESAEIQTTNHVLEIGFGNGQLLKQLCDLITSGKVYGADISPDLIHQVNKRLFKSIESNKLELQLAEVSKLPFPDNSFDTIITNNTIYFWPTPAQDSKELLRILKPNGKLIIGFRTADDMKNYPFVTENLDIFRNHYSTQEVEQLLLQAGFSAVRFKGIESDLANSHVAICTKN